MTLTGSKLKRAFDRIVAKYIEDKPCDLVKADFKDAINAIDDWLDLPATKTAINNQFPTNFKTKASVNDKIEILLAVLEGKLRG